MKYEILAPGMVYYQNAILEPEDTIVTIEHMQQQLQSGVKSAAQSWHEWNGANPDIEKFCIKHFIVEPTKTNEKDPLYKEISLVYNNIFNGINKAFNHYSTELYPAASKNIKSTEGMLSILKYSKMGYLPAHQDQGVSSRVLSTVGYLNDNYSGGEIYFPYVNVTVKPMSNGIRYAVPQWYHSLKEPRMSTGEE